MIYCVNQKTENQRKESHTMNTNVIDEQNQTVNSGKLGIFKEYFAKFKVGSLLNKSGIVKTKGATPLEIFSNVFNLPFAGKNFYEGIVRNDHIGIGKDAVYNFLNTATYNWRRFTLLLFFKIYFAIGDLRDDASEEVLIFDDSTYDRNRSKKVELLSKVFDHSTHKYLKGYRMLTLGWSDGNSFLGVDFALLSSTKKEHRYSEINPDIDKRTCGYQRRTEAITKSTELMEPMIERALKMGVKSKYVLMDSWFSMPVIIECLRKHIHVICMLKDQPTWLYEYQGKKLRLSELYGKLKKKRGKAKIKAEVIVKTASGKLAKIIFVPGDNKKGWLALLSTDLDLPGEEIVRLYGKRWDIEVFFKMCKQHLKLVKEIQIRNYDGLIAHTSIVIARYNLLSLFQRQSVDQRSFGDLFRACNDEMTNITFLDALQRILSLSVKILRKAHALSDKIIQELLDTVMDKAMDFWGLKIASATFDNES